MKVFKVNGSYYQMGLQHGQEVWEMRSLILKAMDNRLRLLDRLPADVHPFEQELTAAWESMDAPLMQMLHGLSDALDLEWTRFFRYTVASYLSERASSPISGQGCTSWAVNGLLTFDEAPLLAKNRDYRPDHRQLQCLVIAEPEKGYKYSYLTSAGSPGVFSSGMNEKGLAVADTHVTSLEIGPGLARYSVMMKLLERFSRVSEALEYLKSIPHLGDGTLTLADAEGETAVFEAGYLEQGVVRDEKGYIVATNHYVTGSLKEKWLDISPIFQRGNSQERYATVDSALKQETKGIDLTWARRLMASHVNPRGAICRHPEYEPNSETISTVFYQPKSRGMLVAFGMPCRTTFYSMKVGKGH
jgi:isopenicillin-N N-acyltransferase like protein